MDSTGFAPYQRGGIVTQVKPPKTLAFKPLARALEEPGEFLLSDFSKVTWVGKQRAGDARAPAACGTCARHLS